MLYRKYIENFMFILYNKSVKIPIDNIGPMCLSFITYHTGEYIWNYL